MCCYYIIEVIGEKQFYENQLLGEGVLTSFVFLTNNLSCYLQIK